MCLLDGDNADKILRLCAGFLLSTTFITSPACHIISVMISLLMMINYLIYCGDIIYTFLVLFVVIALFLERQKNPQKFPEQYSPFRPVRRFGRSRQHGGGIPFSQIASHRNRRRRRRKTPTHGVILIKKFTHSFQATRTNQSAHFLSDSVLALNQKNQGKLEQRQKENETV